MKQYIGTKVINAMPMNRQDYNDFRGWTLPEDENGEDEGYLVEYMDGGKANTSQYAGYVSWSPKEVFERSYEFFERSYKVSETPLDSLIIERDELMDKYNELVMFLGREDAEDIVGKTQLVLMEQQKKQMKDYLITLKLRIEIMKKIAQQIADKQSKRAR